MVPFSVVLTGAHTIKTVANRWFISGCRILLEMEELSTCWKEGRYFLVATECTHRAGASLRNKYHSHHTFIGVTDPSLVGKTPSSLPRRAIGLQIPFLVILQSEIAVRSVRSSRKFLIVRTFFLLYRTRWELARQATSVAVRIIERHFEFDRTQNIVRTYLWLSPLPVLIVLARKNNKK